VSLTSSGPFVNHVGAIECPSSSSGSQCAFFGCGCLFFVMGDGTCLWLCKMKTILVRVVVGDDFVSNGNLKATVGTHGNITFARVSDNVVCVFVCVCVCVCV